MQPLVPRVRAETDLCNISGLCNISDSAQHFSLNVFPRMSVKRESQLLPWVSPRELSLWQHLSVLKALLKFKDTYFPYNMLSKHKPNPSPGT